GDPFRERADLVDALVVQQRLNLIGRLLEQLTTSLETAARRVCRHEQDAELRREALGRQHTPLGSGREQDRFVYHAVQTGALDVDQRRQSRPAALRGFHRIQQVDGLAALAQADDQAALVEEIGQVAELGTNDAVRLSARDAREQILAAARGVRSRAAADQ